ncbi:MAG: T9SS type A sorting domain-containing protein [Bacteroidota bacterium]
MKKFISTLFVFLIFSNVVGVAQTTIPTWMNGKPLNEWFEIPNTSGAAGAVVDAWGGWAPREDSSELYFAASGGHGDSWDNRVVSIRLTDNAPTWILRSASSPFSNVINDAAYYSDGKPGARHIYQGNLWVPAVNRVMMFGLNYTYPNAWQYFTVDGFNPTTNTWDPAGTWSNVQGGFGAVRESNSSVVWTQDLKRWDPNTDTYSTPITIRTNTFIMFPVAHDTKRGQLFTLQIGDGQGYDLSSGIQASRIPITGNQQFAITFNNSTAKTQFEAEAQTYSAMDYDPDNDRFLFYCGQDNASGRIYVITPNSGNVWDISILQLGPGSITPVVVPGSGINRRFSYIPALKGFVMLPQQSSNLCFIRTAPIVPTEVADNESSTEQVTVFPNPSATTFYVALNSNYTGEVIISVKNALGQIVKQETLTKTNSYSESIISLEGEVSGVYFLQVQTSNRLTVKQLIKLEDR